MKLFLITILCLLICYIHLTSSESSTKEENTAKAKPNSKESAKNTGDDGSTKPKDENKVNIKNANDHASTTKTAKTPNIRTPFDKVLDKLSNCAVSSTISPSIAEVMHENLKELQSDDKYISLFNAAPHTAAFLKNTKQDSTKFISGLRQALNADWSNPVWKSGNEIDTLFRPFKQQFVYTMMRFNCT